MIAYSTPIKNVAVKEDFMTPQMKMDLRKELQQAISKRNVLTGRSKMKIIKMLDVSEVSDLSMCNDYDRRDQLRRKSIEEILTSEQAYIKQLDKLMDYFVVPMKEKMLIDFISHQCLFGQLELIYNLNKELLERLENDLDDCANAFLKLAPFFKIYSVYAFDFKQSLILLQVCEGIYANRFIFIIFMSFYDFRILQLKTQPLSHFW